MRKNPPIHALLGDLRRPRLRKPGPVTGRGGAIEAKGATPCGTELGKSAKTKKKKLPILY